MKHRKYLALAVALSAFASPASAANYTSTVKALQASHTTLSCFFFQLDGVTSIDPPSPAAWFAVSLTDPDFKQIYAMVLSAKISGTAIHVQTSGSLSCGYADASYVFIL